MVTPWCTNELRTIRGHFVRSKWLKSFAEWIPNTFFQFRMKPMQVSAEICRKGKTNYNVEFQDRKVYTGSHFRSELRLEFRWTPIEESSIVAEGENLSLHSGVRRGNLRSRIRRRAWTKRIKIGISKNTDSNKLLGTRGKLFFTFRWMTNKNFAIVKKAQWLVIRCIHDGV